jgi:hypothetical protein
MKKSHYLAIVWVISGNNEHNVATYDPDKDQMDA